MAVHNRNLYGLRRLESKVWLGFKKCGLYLTSPMLVFGDSLLAHAPKRISDKITRHNTAVQQICLTSAKAYAKRNWRVSMPESLPPAKIFSWSVSRNPSLLLDHFFLLLPNELAWMSAAHAATQIHHSGCTLVAKLRSGPAQMLRLGSRPLRTLQQKKPINIREGSLRSG